MNNKWIKLVSVLVLGMALYLGTQHLLRPQGIEGDKSITIIIDHEGIDQTLNVNTNALTLGELFEELHQAQKLTITFSGAKTDPFGRGLQGINNVKTENMSVGPQWWGWTSENNTQCVADGYCLGVDYQTLEDGNIFVFTFKGFE
jgi:hypothetical protein